jgi:tetraacyldisaccharide 4'-kinase
MKSREWLAPLGAAFGAAGALRTRLYARGVLRRQSLAGPVISVGNLAVGGRGKTPLAARIAGLLLDSGQRVAILSRGYGGNASAPLLVSDGTAVLAGADAAGDEPVMLARSLPGVIVAVATRRVEAGRLVEARYGPCVFVLDDGFQHLGLARDLDLVAIDAEDLAGRPMPAGVLRERPEALARADLVLLSARNGSPLPPGLDASRTLRWHRRSLGFFSPEGLARPMPSRAFVIAAIAAPERLIADLSGLGCRVVGQALFRDHHRFTADELESAAAAARAAGSDAVVTTEKDAVRLVLRHDESPELPWPPAGPRLIVHRVEAVLEDEGRLREILLRAARAA